MAQRPHSSAGLAPASRPNTTSAAIAATAATERLWQLTIKFFSSRLPQRPTGGPDELNPTTLEQCVSEGADVLYKEKDEPYPVLFMIAKKGHLGYFRQCLSSPSKLDFRVKNKEGQNLFHALCDLPDAAVAKQLLEALVERIENHKSDVVPLNGKNKRGHNFLSHAAFCQRLSLFFPVVRHLNFGLYDRSVKEAEAEEGEDGEEPTFTPRRLGPSTENSSDFKGKIRLTEEVWYSDWERLSAEDKERLELTKGGVPTPTRGLWRLSQLRVPPLADVQQCVKAGAAITESDEGELTLHAFLIKELVECVGACLESPLDIQFTLQDRYGRTPLHVICDMKSADKGKECLRLIVQRIESHTGDVIDWKATNKDGRDFLSYAAYKGRLSFFYPLVSAQPFFAGGKTPIMAEVNRKDWEQLSDSDRGKLVPKEGFDDDSVK